MSTEPSAPLPLGAFDLHRRIAVGGMGEVWTAKHRASGLPAAVKLVRGRAIPPEWVEAFADEVRAVAALDHPGIVRVFDHGVVPEHTARASEGRLDAGFPWLAMEYAGGGDMSGLRGRLGRRDGSL